MVKIPGEGMIRRTFELDEILELYENSYIYQVEDRFYGIA
jgi:hypothetical protein